MIKKRPEKRRATDEEMSRAADARLKRYVAKAALELAEKEPEVRRLMIAQTFGYPIPDPTEKRRSELRDFIDRQAIERLKEDDGFVREIVEARIRQVAQEMDLHIEGRQRQRGPFSLDDYIEQFEKVNELKEVLGVKEPGFWDLFKDPQIIAGILGLISKVFTPEQPPAENNIRVMVQEDGINRLVTVEEYKEMTGKEPLAYIGGEEPSVPDGEAKSNGHTPGPETTDEIKAEDGEAGTTSPD